MKETNTVPYVLDWFMRGVIFRASNYSAGSELFKAPHYQQVRQYFLLKDCPGFEMAAYT